MDKEELLQRFSKIKMWAKGGERAPHKPLMIIYAIGQMQRGERYIGYISFEKGMNELFDSFGPPRKTSALNPFLRLANDKIWTFERPELLKPKIEDNTLGLLRKNNISGGFTDEIYELLKNDTQLQKEIVTDILDKNFPETLHQDILDSVGLNFEMQSYQRKERDPNFRLKILDAYESKCAVCSFYITINRKLAGIEAAHIKWHQAGGPDVEHNGIAMCSLHHKLFDLGAFKINDSMQLIVSEKASGAQGFNEWLINFHKKTINRPVSSKYYPDEEFLSWHVKEVFKGYERD